MQICPQNLTATGTFVTKPGEARINIDLDFCKFYKSLILQVYKNANPLLQLPKYGAHITIVSSKIHGWQDTSELESLQNQRVQFTYDPNIKLGGTKFKTFYVSVVCEFAEMIKRKLKIQEPETFLGLHICICNTKSHEIFKKETINNKRLNL